MKLLSLPLHTYTPTYEDTNIPAHQPTNISAHQHKHTNTATHEHTNTSTHQPIITQTHQPTNTQRNQHNTPIHQHTTHTPAHHTYQHTSYPLHTSPWHAQRQYYPNLIQKATKMCCGNWQPAVRSVIKLAVSSVRSVRCVKPVPIDYKYSSTFI